MPLTLVDQGLLSTNAQYTGFKNRLINGDMVIDQRNNGATVTPADTAYTLDRWQSRNDGKFSVARSTVAPAGFTNSLLVTSLSSYSVGATDFYTQAQQIEGFNVADLGWGTANAQTVTLSFWVRSSLTGTFGGALRNSGGNRSYVFSYSIPSANTWTNVSVTIPGDTTGTWLTDNGVGIRVEFGLGVGSSFSGTAGVWAANANRSVTGAVSVVGTNGATWQMTGAQLEKGQTATSFDVLPYGTELALCQRYFEVEVISGSTAYAFNVDGANKYLRTTSYSVTKRATPTAVIIGTPTYFCASSLSIAPTTTTATHRVTKTCAGSGEFEAGNYSVSYSSEL